MEGKDIETQLSPEIQASKTVAVKPLELGESCVQKGYQILDRPAQREVLKRRIVDMVKTAENADIVFFLDKSARPLSLSFWHLFQTVFPDKHRPQIRYVNIGTEKQEALIGYVNKIKPGTWWDYQKPRANIEPLLGYIADQDSLRKIYEDKNAEELFKILEGSKGGNRIVVDEVTDTGNTRGLVKKIITAADPFNNYNFFTLIDSSLDKEPFKEKGWGTNTETIFLPWRRSTRGLTSLVEDKTDRNSFTTSPQTNTSIKQTGRQLQTEFTQLVNEIKTESKQFK